MKANRTYIEAITTALADETGIKFVERPNKGFSTNIEKRIFYYDQNSFNEMDIEEAKGIILHETGHLKYTKTDGATKLQKQFPVMQDLYNIGEDMRIENKLMDEYGDFAKQALVGSNLMGFDMQNEAPDLKERATLGEKYTREEIEKLKPVDKLSQYMRGLSALTGAYNYKENNCDRLGMYLEKNGYESKSVIGLASSLLDKLDNDVRVKLKALQDDISTLSGLRTADSCNDLRDIVDREIYPQVKEWINSDQKPKPQGGQIPVQVRGRGDCEIHKSRPVLPSDSEIDGLFRSLYTTLARRLKDILKENASVKYRGQYLSGKLSIRNTYKIVIGENRVFSRKNIPDCPKYAITMLLDSSGSMSGSRFYNTYQSAYLLKRACELLGFKINFYKYSNDVEHCKLSDYRDFMGGGNMDDKALQAVIENIDIADSNIVLHLTDGGLCKDITKELARLKAMHAEVIGIGIRTQEVRSKFPNAVVVDNVEDLPMALINLLRKLIHR